MDCKRSELEVKIMTIKIPAVLGKSIEGTRVTLSGEIKELKFNHVKKIKIMNEMQ